MAISATMLKTEAEWCDALKERCWYRLTDWERDFLEGVRPPRSAPAYR
jgi:hypothetical protein